MKAVSVALGMLSAKERRIFGLLTLGRMAANLMDLFALALVGLLGLAIAQIVGDSPLRQVDYLGINIEVSNEEHLVVIAIVASAFFVSKSLFASLLLWFFGQYLAGVETEIAEKSLRSATGSGLGRFQEFSRGKLVWVTHTSPQHTISGLLGAFASVVVEVSLLAMVTVLFFVVSPVDTLFILGYFLLVIALFQFFALRRAGQAGKKVVESSIQVLDIVNELFGSYRQVRVGGHLDYYVASFSESRKRYAASLARQVFFGSLPRYLIESALIVGICILLLFQVLNGEGDGGLETLAIFLAGGLRMMAALVPLQNAITNLRFLSPQSAAPGQFDEPVSAAGTSLRVSAHERCYTKDEPENAQGFSVSVMRASFRYGDGPQFALQNVTLEIASGSHVALVGQSGSGKTTLVDLILGLNEPTSGSVTVSGAKASNLLGHRKGLIAYLPQNPGLVKGSVAKNVAFGVDENEVDPEKVWEAIHSVQLEKLVMGLPEGIDSLLGEQSQSLSAGQMQRLSLARALYSRPRLLVLDEPTSSLDASTERFVTETIAGLGKATTVITIAHRLATVMKSEKVFFLDSGRILAEGNFSEVRRKVPLFAQLIEDSEIS